MNRSYASGELPGKPLIGYKNIRTVDGKRDIVVDDFLANIVQIAFKLYATGTYSMDMLRAKLNKDYGIEWSHGFMDFILKTHFYYDIMVRNNKTYTYRYPPLITKELFDSVQQVKAGFCKKPAKLAGQPYVYRGMIRCATCGLAITPEKHKGHVYYHCTEYKGKHDAAWLREEKITEQLAQVFMRLRMPKDILEQITQTLNEVHQQKMELQNKLFDKLTKDQKSLTTMMDNLYMDKLKGSITDSAYDRFYQKFREQLDEINDQLARLQEAENNYYITTKYVLELPIRAHELFIASEVEERRQLIKFLLSNLQLDGEKIV